MLELFSLEISLIVENAQNDLQASQTERLTWLRTTKLDSFTRYLTQFPSKSQQKSFFCGIESLVDLQSIEYCEGTLSCDNMNEVEFEVNLKVYFGPISFYYIRQTQWVAETNGFYFFCLPC